MHIDPTQVMRDPKDPLTRVERHVFGDDAKLHPITKMPLEQGSGALSADKQAAQHFVLLCGQLSAMCEQYKVATDPVVKNRIRLDHETNAANVAEIGAKLIDEKIIVKTALGLIPQL
jgi:hypothetical protein